MSVIPYNLVNNKHGWAGQDQNSGIKYSYPGNNSRRLGSAPHLAANFKQP